MTTLVFQVNYEDRQVVSARWCAFDRSGTQLSEGEGELIELASFVETLSDGTKDEMNIVALLPDRDVLYVRTRIPGNNKNRISRAAPYAIEQLLTNDIENMHVAIGDFVKGEVIPVAALENEYFANTLQTIREAGIEPHCVSTLGLLTPVDPNEVAVLINGDTAVIRTYDQMAEVSIDVLPQLLPGLISSSEDEQEIFIRFVTDTPTTEAFDTWSQTLSYAASEVINHSVVGYVIEKYDIDSAFNLLQGKYESTDIYTITRSKWAEVASVVMVCLVVSSVVLGVEGYWAEHNADLLRSSGNDLYQKIFDEPNAFGNPADKMQERMGLATGPTEGFSRMLSIVASSSNNDEVTNLWYRDAEGKLSVSLRLRNYDRLDSLKEAMQQDGTAVDIRTAEQRDNVVIANLDLRLQ